MTFLQLFVLALVQGITEFLPISSSAHLILIPQLTGWQDQGTLIDVAVHVGTLLAVLIYFRSDVIRMAVGLLHLAQRRFTAEARLVSLIFLSAVPIILAGPIIYYFGLTGAMRNVEVIGWATLIFGVLLYVADQLGASVRRLEDLRVGGVLAVGIAQVLALIPGTSRSGITLTAARMLGFERAEAARLAMLMSIPTIAGAGVLGGLEIYKTAQSALQTEAFFAAALAFVSALVAISLFMRWLQHASLTPFVVYRLMLGTGLLGWVYFY